MKKIIKYLKEIHFIEYTVYLVTITIINIHYKIEPKITMILLWTLSFSFMNTWYIEKREIKKAKEKIEKENQDGLYK